MYIDQEIIEEKTNKITAILDVIKRLNIKGIICTRDALNTQKNTVKAVVEGKSNYVGALKGNQGTFYQEVIDYFDEEKVLIIEAGQERLKNIGLVVKTSENKRGEKVVEKRYYISSLLLDIQFLKSNKKSLERRNKLQWQLDFTFKADENTTINKRALFNLQIIKKVCTKYT